MKKRVTRHTPEQPQDPSYRLIPLTKNQNALVDAIDFDWLSKYNWIAQWNKAIRGFYARRGDKYGRTISMHSQILNCQKGESADHIDHDPLNNTRKNLRKCTWAQNAANMQKHRQNSSGFKGVLWSKQRKKWQARICPDGKQVHCGFFESAEEAANAYDEAAKQHFGEFAHLNFPHATRYETSAKSPE